MRPDQSKLRFAPIAFANLSPGIEVWLASSTEILGSIDPAFVLSSAECSHALTLRLSGDRERFVAGRILLRHALSAAAGGASSPPEWRFRLSPNGKPEVDSGLPTIPFNLSHAGACVAVAVGRRHPVGIDIEGIAPEDRGETVVDALSDRERALLDQMDRERERVAFIRLWTVKEACAKALGLGVSMEFRSIEVELDPLSVSIANAQPGVDQADFVVASETVQCDGRPYCLSVVEAVAP
jgi:4'-phosphopantetheinyl transferase